MSGVDRTPRQHRETAAPSSGKCEPLLGVAQVMERLGLSRSAAYREMQRMEHVIVGEKSVRVTSAALEAYIRSRTVAPWSGPSHRPEGKLSKSNSRVASAGGSAGPGTAPAAHPSVLRPVFPRTKPRRPD